jgi:hypothetical protein
MLTWLAEGPRAQVSAPVELTGLLGQQLVGEDDGFVSVGREREGICSLLYYYSISWVGWCVHRNAG